MQGRINFVLGLLDAKIEDDIKELEPRERATLWKDLQEFMTPKLARTEVKHEGAVEVQVFEINGKKLTFG